MVIWSDEKIFALHPQGKKFKVKILPEESSDDFSLPKVQQGGQKVMVWGGICSKGKVYFSVLRGKVDSKHFSKFLEQEAFPAIRALYPGRWILQLDNAPPHKGETKKLLEKLKIESLSWPPKSPDLNPIEKVWGWMAKDVYTKTFNNIRELEDYVISLWGKMPEDIILAYINKLKDKINYVNTHNGDLCPSHF